MVSMDFQMLLPNINWFSFRVKAERRQVSSSYQLGESFLHPWQRPRAFTTTIIHPHNCTHLRSDRERKPESLLEINLHGVQYPIVRNKRNVTTHCPLVGEKKLPRLSERFARVLVNVGLVGLNRAQRPMWLRVLFGLFGTGIEDARAETKGGHRQAFRIWNDGEFRIRCILDSCIWTIWT